MVELVKKEDLVIRVIREHPETLSIFSEMGFGCFGCPYAHFETIEQIAKAYNIDVEGFLKKLNDRIRLKEGVGKE